MEEVLLDEVSPFGTAKALVEADGRTVYAYMLPVDPAQEWGMRAVWVTNELDVRHDHFDIGQQMAEGVAPVVGAAACTWPDGRPRPKPEDLSVAWWPAGDGFFLLERDELAAVVPPWADSVCPGYSLAAATTLSCDTRPSTWRWENVLLVAASEFEPLAPLGTISLPHHRTATVLVLVPISAEERVTATNEGSQKLLGQLRSADPWWFLRL